ncbi:COG1470 family protein [Streptomyces sp. NPDC001340]
MPSAARFLGLALFLLPVSAPHAQAAPAWSLAPVGAGRPSFYAEGAPGTVLQDTVSVTNRGQKPLTVQLRGTGVRIAFARTGLRVPARTRAEVPFTVTVPTGAAPGDRSGTVTARDADGRTAAVALRLRVGGPALSALTVEHVAVHGDRITYELVNRGTTTLVPKLAVHADGLFGPVLDRPARTLPVQLPPASRRTLSEPWPGRPALDDVDVRLTVTAAGGAHDTTHTSARFVPWGAVTGVLGAVGAAAVLVAVRRGRRRRSTAEDDEHADMDMELTGAVT